MNFERSFSFFERKLFMESVIVCYLLLVNFLKNIRDGTISLTHCAEWNEIMFNLHIQ